MTLKSAALAYANLGLHVFPLAPRSKKTLKGSHGLNDATADKDQITQWWDEHPDANIGCNAGASHLAILDADLYKPGAADCLEDLADELGGLPDTWLALTGGGGHQYFFRCDEDLRSGADCFGHGIDFKARGGYVVLPPSVHPSGRRYEWEASSTPLNAELADIPVKLAQRRARQEPSTPTVPPPVAQHEHSDPYEVRDALTAVPAALADGYDTWVEVGMALQAALGPAGYEPWCSWSSTSEKYKPAEMQAKWDSFKSNGIGPGTLFKLAMDHGWKQKVYTIKDFERDTQEWQTIEAGPEGAEPFPTVLMGDVEPQEVTYLVQDLILSKGRGLVTGAPGSGKSYLTAEIAVSVASGTPVLGQLAVEQAPVLVYNAEDDPGTITRPRMGAIAEARGIQLAHLPIYHINISTLDISDPEDMARLAQTIPKIGARLLILDPLRDLHGADEDNSTAMKPILQGLRLLEQETGAVVIVVHHDRKGQADGRRESRARGSTALTGWRSFSIGVDHMGEADIHRVTPYVKAARSGEPWAFRMDEGGALEQAKLTRGRQGGGDADRLVLAALPIGTELSRSDLEVAAGLSRGQIERAVRRLLDQERVEVVIGSNKSVASKVRRAPWEVGS